MQNKRPAMHDKRNTLQDYGHKKNICLNSRCKIPINNFYRSALHVSTKFLMPLWYNPLCCHSHNLVTEGGDTMDYFTSYMISVFASLTASFLIWLYRHKR